MHITELHTEIKNISTGKGIFPKTGLHSPVTNQVGKIIKRLRAARDLTQEALADAVGISGSQVSNIERGERDVDTELLAKIAAALGVHVTELFEGQEMHFTQVAGDQPTGMSVRDKGTVYFSMPGHISAEEREKIEDLLKHLGGLPSNEKELVYDLIDAIFRRKRG